MNTNGAASRSAPATSEARVGMVDCLGIGFEKVNRILWVLAFPVLLSLFLWQGPSLSAAPAFNRAIDWYVAHVPADALDAAGDSSATAGVPARELVESLTADGNVFSFLTFGAGIAGRGSIPTLLLPAAKSVPPVAVIERPAQALGVIAGIFVLGLLLGAIYLGLIGQCVRGEATNVARLARRVWGYWLSILGFLLVVALAAMVVIVPVGLTLGLAAAFAPDAAALIFWAVVAGWQVAAVWLTLFTFFVIDAAVVGELGPIRALRYSITIVSRNFWSAAGFIALYLLISYGMLALWGRLGDAPGVVVLAILANAYIASGLAAGSMLYYRTRTVALARLQAVTIEQA